MTNVDELIRRNEELSSGGIDVTLKYIQRDINAINQKLDDKYVTKDEFRPVRMVVYGMVTLILSAVILAIVYLVISH